MIKTIRFENDDLYITDDPMLLDSLLKMGKEAIPCLDGRADPGDFAFTRYAVSDLSSLFENSDPKDTLICGRDFIPDHLLKIHQRLKGLPWDILETGRLKVRETTLSDVDRFYEIYNDPSTTMYIEPLFEDREEELEYTRNYIETIYGFYGYGIWTVIEKDTGRIIGRAGVTDREGFDIPEIGFVIAPESRKKGYAFEVCSSILDHAKTELGFTKIQALVKPQNTVSINLLKKLGFEITRKLHQDYLIALRTLS